MGGGWGGVHVAEEEEDEEEEEEAPSSTEPYWAGGVIGEVSERVTIVGISFLPCGVVGYHPMDDPLIYMHDEVGSELKTITPQLNAAALLVVSPHAGCSWHYHPPHPTLFHVVCTEVILRVLCVSTISGLRAANRRVA